MSKTELLIFTFGSMILSQTATSSIAITGYFILAIIFFIKYCFKK